MRRIVELDGLRGLAVLLVCVAHERQVLHFNHRMDVVWLYVGDGDLGVAAFFVLSGYLITTLALREIDATGRLDVRAFYVRRIRRIFPAFYAFLTCVAIAAAAGAIVMPAWALAASALFVRNFFVIGQFPWWTGHVWSLAIEQQFYLLWPIVFLIGGPVAALRTALASVAIFPLARVAAERLVPAADAIHWAFATDTVAWGCLLAFAMRDPRVTRWLASAYARGAHWFALAFVLVIVPTLLAKLHAALATAPVYALQGLALDVVLFAALRPGGAFAAALRPRALVWVGTISYSLYLWQQPWLTNLNTTWSGRFPVNIAVAIVCAAASFYLIERPASRAGKRRERPVAPAAA